MFADLSGTVVMFDDTTLMACKDGFVDYFHCDLPVTQRGRNTVEQLGGV